ncbi:hypothetical protein AMS68_002265 [Peltaster fructicola]|uniref:Uncharacterized protein n=1 Tax=Peltaster fructicola TaxID=286661 RepID=A0A6H0XQ34_9PEZI|nr:hypothetical protein AMS68_002265 [Peltaster fructicola]
MGRRGSKASESHKWRGTEHLRSDRDQPSSNEVKSRTETQIERPLRRPLNDAHHSIPTAAGRPFRSDHNLATNGTLPRTKALSNRTHPAGLKTLTSLIPRASLASAIDPTVLNGGDQVAEQEQESRARRYYSQGKPGQSNHTLPGAKVKTIKTTKKSKKIEISAMAEAAEKGDDQEEHEGEDEDEEEEHLEEDIMVKQGSAVAPLKSRRMPVLGTITRYGFSPASLKVKRSSSDALNLEQSDEKTNDRVTQEYN